MRNLLFSLVFIVLFSFPAVSQEIKGKVVDVNDDPVDAVAVILQTRDSLFVDAVITNEEGDFTIPAGAGEYLLYFQHILYETLSMQCTTGEIGIVRLKEKENTLADITVTAERPTVKVEAGKLVYDTPRLIQNKPVTNAFEAIRELPGITGTDESLELVGAANLHIVINGQLTTMTLDQLIGMLKMIPASRIKSTEVMYNAPARYNVKGAIINVVLDQPDGEVGETLQGEAGSEYRQHYYAKGLAHANVVYNNGNLGMDLLVNGEKGRSYTSENMFARHTLENEKVEINQNNGGRGYYNKGSVRLGMDYTFKNSDKLSGVYYIEGLNSDSRRTSSTTYDFLQQNRTEKAESSTEVDGSSRLQNAQIQYKGHQGVTVGVDYTNYYSPDKQNFLNEQQGSDIDLLNTSEQNINKWMGFANHNLKFAGMWDFTYGVNVSLTRSKTYVEYAYKTGGNYIPDEESLLDDLQKEWGGNAFVQLARSFGRFSADVSLKAEYFRSDYNSNGKEMTLWNDWAFFPTASLSYTISSFHILQLNVSSDKKYPSYWSVNPQTNYINSYSVIQGNPELKPSRSYEGQLVYILKQKYVFVGFAEYHPDKFTQLPYQSNEALRNSFRFENLDYSLTYGVAAIIPFKAIPRVDSRVTAHGIRLQDKSSHFYDTPFNNSRIFGRLGLNNTINISDSRPNLKMTIDGYYVSPALQGVYRLGYFYDVSTGLKWLFAGGKGTLTFKYENIFRSHYPSYMKVETGDQYSNMSLFDNSSFAGVAFAWKFGGYKEKKYAKIDDSRFGK